MLKTTSKEFNKYGYLLDIDCHDVIDYLINKSPMPKENNLYVRDDLDMHELSSLKQIKEIVYGFSKIETGYVNGYNNKLNCLEYHNAPEVDIAATDQVLLLAGQEDIHNGVIDSKDVKAFYVKKGQCLVLYPYTLHFSPCLVNKEGFKCAIILPDGTNRDLENKTSDPKLWKENKWLFAHPSSKQASMGAYIGIIGDNIDIKDTL